MIKKIESYITSDGILFDSYIKAEKHENNYQKYMMEHPNKIPQHTRYLTACGKYISKYEKKFTVNEIFASNFMCIPHCNGNYLWYNVHNKKVYSGETKDLNSRVRVFLSNSQYSYGNLDEDRKKCTCISDKEETWILFIINSDINEIDLKYNETNLMLKFDTINPLHGYNDHISITKEKYNVKKRIFQGKKPIIK